MARIRFKHTGKVASWLIRGIASTLTYEVVDHAEILRAKIRPPLIWTFWHNRLFLIPYVHQRWLPDMPGCILSSPSGDGQIIADMCAEFGFEAARGSSSRKGTSALITMAEKIKAGCDLGITPDGPRGPRYHLHAGPLKVAQLTGALIMPVDVQYESAWKFKTWDQFQVPKPFSRVRIVLNKPMQIERRLDEAAFEQRRQEIEQVMRRGATDWWGEAQP